MANREKILTKLPRKGDRSRQQRFEADFGDFGERRRGPDQRELTKKLGRQQKMSRLVVDED